MRDEIKRIENKMVELVISNKVGIEERNRQLDHLRAEKLRIQQGVN